MANNPEKLFELFYQDITPEMNPPGMTKHHGKMMYMWWHERFMNAFFGNEEPYSLRSWAEARKCGWQGIGQNKKVATSDLFILFGLL